MEYWKVTECNNYVEIMTKYHYMFQAPSPENKQTRTTDCGHPMKVCITERNLTYLSLKLIHFLCIKCIDWEKGKNLHYRGSPTCTVSTTSTVSTNMNFRKVFHKIVLGRDLVGKLVLVQLTLSTTQLVQILHRYTKQGPPVFEFG